MPIPLVAFIIEELKRFSDTHRIILAQTNYPTSMTVLGVKIADERRVLKLVQKETKTFTVEEKKKLARLLVETDILECQHLAYEFIYKETELRESLTISDINTLGRNLDNWVSVDTFGIYITGMALKDGILPDSILKNWIKSSDQWLRRLSIVSTIPLNQKSKGGLGDAKRTLEICSLAIHDKSDVVIKGLSWALRELAKVDPIPVEEFVSKQRKILPAKVLREVNNKLYTGKKN